MKKFKNHKLYIINYILYVNIEFKKKHIYYILYIMQNVLHMKNIMYLLCTMYYAIKGLGFRVYKIKYYMLYYIEYYLNNIEYCILINMLLYVIN